MKFVFSIFTGIFLLFSNIGYAQQSSNTKLIKTAYYYSFKTTSDVPDFNNMEQEIKALKNVTEVKIKFKPESKAGQLIVMTKERPRQSEGEVLFQPTDLKRIISSNGFIPNELETTLLTD